MTKRKKNRTILMHKYFENPFDANLFICKLKKQTNMQIINDFRKQISIGSHIM